jgi:hypothetical protein
MTTNNILNDFCALCRNYGLPCDPGEVDRFNWTLFNTFKDKRTGLACTALENIGDPSSVADIARLLAQVMEGDIKVEGRIRTIPYTNRETLGLLKESLVDILKRRVFRYGKKLVLSLNQTAIIVSDNANGPEDGFTFDELGGIVQAVDGLIKNAKNLQGRKAKNADSFTRTKDISPLTKNLADIISEYGLNTVARHCFVADFLFDAGFLDFKGDEWKNEYKTYNDKEKYDFIKAFVD